MYVALAMKSEGFEDVVVAYCQMDAKPSTMRS